MQRPPHVLAYCRIGLVGSCQRTSTPAACIVGEMVAAGFGGTAGAVAALAAAGSSTVLSCRGAIGIGSEDGRYSIRSLNASLYRGSVLISSCQRRPDEACRTSSEQRSLQHDQVRGNTHHVATAQRDLGAVRVEHRCQP